jgi:hypothetical protein
MDDDEYEKLQEERRGNNFIVGDDEGYKDYGGEIWEQEDEYNETVGANKANAGNKSLTKFFFNSKDGKNKKKIVNTALYHNKQTVSNEK